MKDLNTKIKEFSFHLQSLAKPELFKEVQDAVEKKDEKTLVKLCKKADVPMVYLNSIVSVLLSVSPEQKWPTFW